jgi:hypothetical protein
MQLRCIFLFVHFLHFFAQTTICPNGLLQVCKLSLSIMFLPKSLLSLFFFLFPITSIFLEQGPLSTPSSVCANQQPDFLSSTGQCDQVVPQKCLDSHLNAFQTADGPVNITTDPLENFDLPKLSRLNSTSGEQWAFDGTSSTGKAGFLIGFYRDPNYAFLGPGNFRVSFDVVWENGTTWSLVDYVVDSSIKHCHGLVTGVWTKPLHTYTFEIAEDSTWARVIIATPSVKGSWNYTNTAPPRYADGTSFSSQNGSTWNAPFLHWAEPIPAGIVDIDITIDTTPLRWRGMGGHDRWWASYGWLDIMKGWQAIRLTVGPFSMMYWAPTSRVLNGALYPSVVLYQNGKAVFHAQSMNPSHKNRYLVIEPTFHGNVSAGLHSKGTGAELHLVDPETSAHWIFTIGNENTVFQFEIGSGNGGSASVGRAIGGKKGGMVHEGVFFSEFVDVGNLVVPSLYVKGMTWIHKMKAKVLGM